MCFASACPQQQDGDGGKREIKRERERDETEIKEIRKERDETEIKSSASAHSGLYINKTQRL